MILYVNLKLENLIWAMNCGLFTYDNDTLARRHTLLGGCDGSDKNLLWS